MGKWKHPYVIRFNGMDKKYPYTLMALSGRLRGEPRYYRPVDDYSTLKKALKAKKKAYERLQK